METSFETVIVTRLVNAVKIKIYRPEVSNSIHSLFHEEVKCILDEAEGDSGCKMVILEGSKEFFCTGMDFKNATTLDLSDRPENSQPFSQQYLNTLKRLTTIPKIVVAKVEGKTMAGGVGLVAASDIVVCSKEATFCLSEAIWGLLPSIVIPFLMRKIGYQKSYWMTLTTQTVTSEEALRFGLADNVDSDPDDVIRKYLLRASRLQVTTIGNIKNYFKGLGLVTDDMLQKAVMETTRLMSDPKIMNNIKNYVELGKLPWE